MGDGHSPDQVTDASPTGSGHGWTVRHVVETGSTNDDLLAVATDDPTAARVAHLADHQTAGRGRLDRRWDAPAGSNLLCSLLITPPPGEPAVALQAVQHAVALAAVDAARSLVGGDLRLKWPNDVVAVSADGSWRKVAGMLSVAVPARPPSPTRVIVGIGINLGWAPEGGARVVDSAGRSPAPREFLDAMLPVVDALVSAGPTVIHERYRERLDTLGRRVRVEQAGAEAIVGRAVDVDIDGRIVVLDDCAITHRLGVGDVVHLRDEAPPTADQG